MEQCILFWIVFAGFAMLITLIIIVIICLHRLADVKELWERVRDKLASTDTHLNKLESAVEWFLQKEGMKLDMLHWRWYVTPTDDGHLRNWLRRTEDRKRKALADAMYKSTLQAMRDFDKEQKKEAKKK